MPTGSRVAGGDVSKLRAWVVRARAVGALALVTLLAVAVVSRTASAVSREAPQRGAQRARSHRRQPPAPRPAGPNTDPVRQVVERVHRSGAAPRCWNAFIASNSESPSVQFRLRVETDGLGGVRSVIVLDPTPVAFAECVQTQVRALTNVPGPSLIATTTYAFRAGLAAPVPVPVAPSVTPTNAPSAP